MGATTSILQEQNIFEFRKLNAAMDGDEVELPTPPEARQVTDKKGFVVFGTLMLILLPFLTYSLANADIERLLHGHDSCGNLCGVANKKIEGLECSGKDYTGKPYEEIDILTDGKNCTDECSPGYVQEDSSCYGGSAFIGNYTVESEYLWRDVPKSWWKFLLVMLLTTILCMLTLVLFRYIPGVIVWGVTILTVVVLVVLTAFFWYVFSHWKDQNGEKQTTFLGIALVFTILTAIICCVVFVLFKKLKLIIQLYQETAKALSAVPLLLALPLLTMLFQFVVLALMAMTTVLMLTSAHLTRIESSGYYFYHRNWAMNFGMLFNVFVTIWALNFFAGCQYMIISGSVGQWFFRRTENGPILVSFTNTVKFHLGTVAFGSVLLMLVAVIKALIRTVISSARIKTLVDCLCSNVEALLKFLSNNAYIECALHGQSFLRSGRRAAKLLISNVDSAIAINSVGSLVIFMTQLLLLVASTAVAYGLFSNDSYAWVPTIFSFFLNLIIVLVVFGVFETTVDTLFICFCEDMSLNDGQSRPYYMSTGLMQFVENSRRQDKYK